MRMTAEEKQDQSDRQAVERQATTQPTTLTSLLAGFLFDWFTSLVDNELSTPFSLVVLVVTVLTILVLVLASIVGGCSPSLPKSPCARDHFAEPNPFGSWPRKAESCCS
jgi:hypothetical protein